MAKNRAQLSGVLIQFGAMAKTSKNNKTGKIFMRSKAPCFGSPLLGMFFLWYYNSG